jgi:DNA invertase Pin-like site-specific DNA recombinase
MAYYRVSTSKQGRSGLGLEAQRHAVEGYLNGGDWQIVGEFTEVETGKRADRPALAKALAMCRLHGARLVIAKLDRLSRNAHFLLGLKESGVDFVAADMPNANRLTVGIMAMVAEDEAQRISCSSLALQLRLLGAYRGRAGSTSPSGIIRPRPSRNSRRSSMSMRLVSIATDDGTGRAESRTLPMRLNWRHRIDPLRFFSTVAVIIRQIRRPTSGMASGSWSKNSHHRGRRRAGGNQARLVGGALDAQSAVYALLVVHLSGIKSFGRH